MFFLKWKQVWIQIIFWVTLIGVLLFFTYIITHRQRLEDKSVRFGITFSTVYAKSLGLNVQQTYIDLIQDLGVRFVRIPVYWSDIESKKGEYQWSELDNLIKYSETNNVKLTLVIGSKVPRWPECFVPDWAEKLSEDDQQKETLAMMQAVIDRYKKSSAIERWQVANEPFFPFGICQQISLKDFQAQIDLVRRLDKRPIQITVSGEMEPWRESMKHADVLGISLYRKTWSNVFGYFEFPLSPEFYTLRKQLVRAANKKVIISELQAEPWFSEPINNQSTDYWYQKFSAEDFQSNIQFAKETHFDEAYLWGAEWWGYLKAHGDNRLWDVAKEVFNF